MRRFGVLAVAGLVALVSASCGADEGGAGGGSSDAKIAFLMPDIASTRYELFDAPLFTAKMKELCAGCSVLYHLAKAGWNKLRGRSFERPPLLPPREPRRRF